MKYIKLLSLIAFSAILLTSCGKKSNLGKLIPKEAAVVIDLNTKSLLSKLSWEEIKQSYWYNEMMTDSSISAPSKVFIDDPSKTGVDLKSDIIFFVLQPDSSGQLVVEGTLKDSKAFSEFIKNMHPDAAATKDGSLNIFKTSEAVIGWNDERFVCVSNADHHRFHGMESFNDSTQNTVPLAPVSTDNLVTVCKNIFALNGDNSLYKNERFANLADEEGDVHFWMNANELSKASMKGMPGMMGMVKLDKFLEDNVSTGTINFQDGKITGTGKQYFGKELTDIIKKGDGNINTDMIKRLPSQNVAGVMALHFTPGNLLEIIKLTGLDGFINLALAQQGLTLDDVIKATKGDITFSASDVTLRSDSITINDSTNKVSKHSFQRPGATFLFSMAIGDKDAFNKLFHLWNTIGKEAIQKNIFQKTDDKYFTLSNSQDAVNKYFSGAQTTPDYLSKINDHPIGGYVDIQMILKAFQTEITKDSTGKAFYDRNIAMWNNVYFTGGEYKDGGLVSSGELNLVDKTTNSLKQLNQYMNDMVKMHMEEKKKHKEDWRMDSTSMKSKTDTAQRRKH
jgi:hypothetical protein